MINKLDYHTQIYGVTQSGKTFLALKLMSEHPTSLKLFIDMKGQATGDEKLIEINRKKKMADYSQYFLYYMNLTDIEMIIKNEQSLTNGWISLQVDSDVDYTKQLAEFSKIIYDYQKMNPMIRKVILIDEMQEYVTSRSVNQAIRALFVQGLAKDIRVIFTSQGWSMVNKNVRNNCEVTIIMNQRDQDLDAMMELGLLPYDRDKRTGFKISKVKFKRKYQAYMEVGIKGAFSEIQ